MLKQLNLFDVHNPKVNFDGMDREDRMFEPSALSGSLGYVIVLISTAVVMIILLAFSL